MLTEDCSCEYYVHGDGWRAEDVVRKKICLTGRGKELDVETMGYSCYVGMGVSELV